MQVGLSAYVVAKNVVGLGYLDSFLCLGCICISLRHLLQISALVGSYEVLLLSLWSDWPRPAQSDKIPAFALPFLDKIRQHLPR